MAATVGSLAAIITADSADFDKKLDGVSKKLNTVSATVEQSASSWSKLGAIAAGAFAAVGGAIVLEKLTSSIYDLGRASVQMAADWETQSVAFEAMLGSGEKATALLNDLSKMAAATPFQLGDLTKASQQLLVYGFDARDVTGILERLGDVAAASPEGMSQGLERVIRAMGQMQSKGRVMSGEMLQLTEAGIPAWDALAKQIGVSVPKAMEMVERGAVDARTGVLAVLSIGESPKFAGMMTKQAQTLNGLMSTMRDNVSMGMRDLGAIIIQSFDLKGATRQFTDFIGQLRGRIDTIRPVIQAIGDWFTAAKDVVFAGVTALVSKTGDWIEQLTGTSPTLQTARDVALDVFEAITKAVARTSAEITKLAGALLGDVVSPLLQAAAELQKLDRSTQIKIKFNPPTPWQKAEMPDWMKEGGGPQIDLGGMAAAAKALAEKAAGIDVKGMDQSIGAGFDKIRQGKTAVDDTTKSVSGLQFAFQQVAEASAKAGKDFQLHMEASKQIAENLKKELSSPLEKFVQRGQDLQRMLTSKAIDQALYNRALGAASRDLVGAVGMHEIKQPPALDLGSQDVAQILARNAANLQGGEAVEGLKSAIQQQLDQLKRQTKADEAVADMLRRGIIAVPQGF